MIKSRWIQQVRYLDDEGAIELVLTLAVVQGISRIDGVKEFFTQYLLSQTSQLNSVYSARLYELLVQWRSAGKVPMIELVSFREQLGIGVNEYQRIDHFKARVLDSAVKEINEKTDIKVDYEQYKKGRSISGFSFKVKSKQNPKQLDSKRDPDTVDLFTKMTDAQRHLFAKKLSEMPDMSKYSQGTESFQQFAIRIAEMLLQPEKFRELYPFLEKAGFKP